MALLAIKYKRGHLEILNQLLLPEESVYVKLKDTQDGWEAIRTMKVHNNIDIIPDKLYGYVPHFRVWFSSCSSLK